MGIDIGSARAGVRDGWNGLCAARNGAVDLDDIFARVWAEYVVGGEFGVGRQEQSWTSADLLDGGLFVDGVVAVHRGVPGDGTVSSSVWVAYLLGEHGVCFNG